jgi:hypothetical protein
MEDGEFMGRPTKLTPGIQQRIGDNVALGLTYSLAAEPVGITYKTFNEWLKKGKTDKSGKYHQFYQHVTKYNADAAKAFLERLNEAIGAGNCQVCMWILERRFTEYFGRCEYRKINVISENKNENVEITVQEADILRKQILAKFDRF